MEGRSAERPRSAVAWLLEAPAAAWALAAVALAFGVVTGLGDRYLHDEGLLTWHFAQITQEVPAAAFFWQKSRPLLAALYAPFAGLGQPAFTVLHAAVAALALPLLAGAARGIGQRSPNLPALLVASSALWLCCGPAGVSNSDALTGLCLALYLWLARGRPIAAGLLLGALLFARSEAAVFVGGIGLYAWLRGPRRLALAIPAIPGLYALAGALYHHDLLWFLHFPPALPAPPPETPHFGAAGYGAGLGDTLDAFVALTPALPLLLAARPRRMPAIERLVGALAIAYLLAIRGLPAIGLFNFDSSPRYLLLVLPFAALVIGPVIDGWRDGRQGDRATTLALVVALGLGLLSDRLGGSPLPLAAAAGLAGVVALARAGLPRIAALLLALAAAAALPTIEPVTRMTFAARYQGLDDAVAWLAARPELAARPVVTNLSVFGALLDHRGAGGERPIYYLLGVDQDHEIRTLTNPAVGQDAAIWGALDRGFYGRPIRPPMTPADPPPRPRSFVIDDDDRLEQRLPAASWEGRLRELARHGRARILIDEGPPPGASTAPR
ncbi:MAG: hypothetical protein R3B09_33380 [Nannocystaceae bacterium]